MRTRARFIGRVQGVGFRATAHDLAHAAGLTGWVRNEPEGAVLLEVQGEGHAVVQFLQDLRDRMEGLIQGQDLIDLPDDPCEATFAIRR